MVCELCGRHTDGGDGHGYGECVAPMPCQQCGGDGEIPLGEISREMAMDGGDARLEGQIIFGPCNRCSGTGYE